MGSGSSRPGTAPPSYLTPEANIDPGQVVDNTIQWQWQSQRQWHRQWQRQWHWQYWQRVGRWQSFTSAFKSSPVRWSLQQRSDGKTMVRKALVLFFIQICFVVFDPFFFPHIWHSETLFSPLKQIHLHAEESGKCMLRGWLGKWGCKAKRCGLPLFTRLLPSLPPSFISSSVVLSEGETAFPEPNHQTSCTWRALLRWFNFRVNTFAGRGGRR